MVDHRNGHSVPLGSMPLQRGLVIPPIEQRCLSFSKGVERMGVLKGRKGVREGGRKEGWVDLGEVI